MPVTSRIDMPWPSRERSGCLMSMLHTQHPVALQLPYATVHGESSQTGWPSFTAVPVWDHLWPRQATYFPPRMDHPFSVDHLFSTLNRNLGPPEISGWWPPCSQKLPKVSHTGLCVREQLHQALAGTSIQHCLNVRVGTLTKVGECPRGVCQQRFIPHGQQTPQQGQHPAYLPPTGI